MTYIDFGNDCWLFRSEDESKLADRLMHGFLPRDKIEQVGVNESKLGCCTHFAGNVIIDNKANIFIFVTAKIV